MEAQKKYELTAEPHGQSLCDAVNIKLIHFRSRVVSECRCVQNNLLLFGNVIELLDFSYNCVVLTEENIIARHTDFKDLFGGIIMEDFDVILGKTRTARDEIRCRVHHMLYI